MTSRKLLTKIMRRYPGPLLWLTFRVSISEIGSVFHSTSFAKILSRFECV